MNHLEKNVLKHILKIKISKLQIIHSKLKPKLFKMLTVSILIFHNNLDLIGIVRKKLLKNPIHLYLLLSQANLYQLMTLTKLKNALKKVMISVNMHQKLNSERTLNQLPIVTNSFQCSMTNHLLILISVALKIQSTQNAQKLENSLLNSIK